uniref:Uncharacterized protein n=1 Tax=Cacopsylla melanoneura TaxID=428564 RepID=A0A8D8VH57_9HEMI
MVRKVRTLESFCKMRKFIVTQVDENVFRNLIDLRDDKHILQKLSLVDKILMKISLPILGNGISNNKVRKKLVLIIKKHLLKNSNRNNIFNGFKSILKRKFKPFNCELKNGKYVFKKDLGRYLHRVQSTYLSKNSC